MFIVNVQGAVYKAGKWLIIIRSTKEEHAGGTLSFVGGKVDIEGDSPGILEKTVKREIFEEVGIEITDAITYVYSSSFKTDEGCHVINVDFLCEYEKGTAYNKSPDEVESVHWLTYSEIMNHPKTPLWTKESLNRAENIRRKGS